jgi:hypothetical protein
MACVFACVVGAGGWGALKALNISMATSTDSDSVLALVRPGGGWVGGGGVEVCWAQSWQPVL